MLGHSSTHFSFTEHLLHAGGRGVTEWRVNEGSLGMTYRNTYIQGPISKHMYPSPVVSLLQKTLGSKSTATV